MYDIVVVYVVYCVRVSLLLSSFISRAESADAPMKNALHHLDFKRLASSSDEFAKQVASRGVPSAEKLVESLLATRNRALQLEDSLNELRRRRNEFQSVNREEMKRLKSEFEAEMAKLDELTQSTPNWTKPGTPPGNDLRVVRQSSSTVDGKPDARRDHLRLAEKFDLLDFKSAIKTTGPKFAFFKRQAATIELALQLFATRTLAERHRFTPMLTPDLVNPKIVAQCGFRPRAQEMSQIYEIKDHPLVLAGTSEILLAGFLADTEVEGEARLAGCSHCFRTEAGSHGKQDKGLYRLHQFTKVEMFVACAPRESERRHEELVSIQTGLCDALGLQWRVLEMPTEELGNSAYSKFDVEVWMPGSGRWGEVASVTNCTDYQSRRLGIRCLVPSADTQHEDSDNKRKTATTREYAHTLNGTACAVPRVLLAMLETHYDVAKEVVKIPPVLHGLLGFEEIASSAPHFVP